MPRAPTLKKDGDVPLHVRRTEGTAVYNEGEIGQFAPEYEWRYECPVDGCMTSCHQTSDLRAHILSKHGKDYPTIHGLKYIEVKYEGPPEKDTKGSWKATFREKADGPVKEVSGKMIHWDLFKSRSPKGETNPVGRDDWMDKHVYKTKPLAKRPQKSAAPGSKQLKSRKDQRYTPYDKSNRNMKAKKDDDEPQAAIEEDVMDVDPTPTTTTADLPVAVGHAVSTDAPVSVDSMDVDETVEPPKPSTAPTTVKQTTETVQHSNAPSGAEQTAKTIKTLKFPITPTDAKQATKTTNQENLSDSETKPSARVRGGNPNTGPDHGAPHYYPHKMILRSDYYRREVSPPAPEGLLDGVSNLRVDTQDE